MIVHLCVICNFLIQRLSNAYESLAKAYKKVVDVMGTGKRLLGKYFRVAFFGQVTGPLKCVFNRIYYMATIVCAL